MRYELYRASDGWRWRLVAANGRVIADSGEAYNAKTDAEAGIRLVRSSGDDSVTIRMVDGE